MINSSPHSEEQKENWERYGNKQLELLDANAIRREVASDRYTGALLDHSGGHIHPLNLAIGEADAHPPQRRARV